MTSSQRRALVSTRSVQIDTCSPSNTGWRRDPVAHIQIWIGVGILQISERRFLRGFDID